ncbi:MAG TPA: enoyl-CoA hydratase-related protein [Steroidobacteraceae bacterium]|nr:enoyl-CoA hydratase-related protein [Steroidobacteraceae bacterium]
MDWRDRYSTLEAVRQGRCLTVSFARPHKLNAVDALMHTELAALFQRVADDDRIDVIVLTGAGRAFCAGGDLNWQKQAVENPASFNRTVREARQIVCGMLECDRPIIAKVNGPAVGIGATLAVFADAVFIADDTFLSDPHVNVGMTAGDGGALMWPQLIGYMRAKYYLLTGERIAAPEAERIGLVTAAVPRKLLDERVDRAVRRLLSLPQQAVRSTKVATNIPLRALMASGLDASLALESISNVTHDHCEAVEAFLHKRPARFTRRGAAPASPASEGSAVRAASPARPVSRARPRKHRAVR